MVPVCKLLGVAGKSKVLGGEEAMHQYCQYCEQISTSSLVRKGESSHRGVSGVFANQRIGEQEVVMTFRRHDTVVSNNPLNKRSRLLHNRNNGYPVRDGGYPIDVLDVSAFFRRSPTFVFAR